MKIDCRSDEEIERTKGNNILLINENAEELTTLYLKSVVVLLTCVFEKFVKVSVNEFDINPLYCVSLIGFTMQCGIKYTGINFQSLQDKYMISLLEKIIRGGMCSVMGDKYVKSGENKKMVYIEANILFGWAMSQPRPYDEIQFDKNIKLEDIVSTPDDSDIGYFIEIESKDPVDIKHKRKNFSFRPANKVTPQDKFSDIN